VEVPKKGGSKMAMLRERLAAQKAAEEEQERLKQEAIKAIEDEEANLLAEEARIADAKQAKKDKAKEKRDELKKQGLYFTPAQKVFNDHINITRLLKRLLKIDWQLHLRQGRFKSRDLQRAMQTLRLRKRRSLLYLIL
jgi:hypothetical protein